MKKRSIAITAAFVLSSLLLTACGTATESADTSAETTTETTAETTAETTTAETTAAETTTTTTAVTTTAETTTTEAITIVAETTTEATTTAETTAETTETTEITIEAVVELAAPENDGFTEVEYIGYCTGAPVNIRKEPSLEAEKLGTASYGDEISVIGEKTIDSVVWAKINTDNGIAYMVARYISKSMTTETAEAESETVAEPSPSAIVPEIPEDAEGIKYIEDVGGEAYYKYDELDGKEELWVWTWLGTHWEWEAHPALTPEEEAWWEKEKEQDLNGDGNYTQEEYYEWLETQPLEVQERVHAWGDIELHFN